MIQSFVPFVLSLSKYDGVRSPFDKLRMNGSEEGK